MIVLIVLGALVVAGVASYLLDYFCCSKKKRTVSKKYQVYNGPLPSYGWL